MIGCKVTAESSIVDGRYTLWAEYRGEKRMLCGAEKSDGVIYLQEKHARHGWLGQLTIGHDGSLIRSPQDAARRVSTILALGDRVGLEADGNMWIVLVDGG